MQENQMLRDEVKALQILLKEVFQGSASKITEENEGEDVSKIEEKQ